MKHLSTMKYLNPMKYINTMKHIFTISYRKALVCALTALSLLCGVEQVYARRTFYEKEKLYINIQQSFDWSSDGAQLYLYIWGPDDRKDWVQLQTENHPIWAAYMPEGEWDGLKVVRGNTSWIVSDPWKNVWNQSGDISIEDQYNCLCLYESSTSWGRYFHPGEKVYVQTKTGEDGNYDWGDGGVGCNLLMHLWGPNGQDWWLHLSSAWGEVYGAELPYGGYYNGCKIIRKHPGHAEHDESYVVDDDKAKTQGMAVKDIYLYKYWKNGTRGDWSYTLPDPARRAPYTWEIPSYESLTSSIKLSGGHNDAISVCPSTFTNEEPFSLRCPVNSEKTNYDYGIVTHHGWYKSTDGVTWTSVDDRAGNVYGSEGDRDILDNKLPASGTAIYYYLYSANSNGRRLIKVTNDATTCDPTCDITSFELAVSAVNVDDNTFTLDGMVAFEQADGELVIECDGHPYPAKIVAPVSPQVFSIPGIAAATTDGVKKSVTARFSGDASCYKTIEVDVPNATAAGDTTRVHILAGKTTTLTPSDAVSSNTYNWRKEGATIDGASQIYTTVAQTTDDVSTYDYREYNPISGTMADMMSNGDYNKDIPVSVYGSGLGSASYVSDYIFWDRYDNTSTDINFYKNTTINPVKDDGHPTYESNGFAVVKSAHNFFKTYAKVTARGGDDDYFGLFDAEKGAAGGNKRAWFAVTDDTHNPQPNLKLKKGTTYVFSFWAANINNYGEMMNPATLQFKIKYTDTDNVEHTENLGSVLDLGSSAFLNNNWHQRSATFKSDYDADKVEIMVMNTNTNEMITGNDFALDDIQFHAISTVSRTVKEHDVFVVTTHEPAITEFTATPNQMACNELEYAVDLQIKYKNQPSKLIVKDITDGGDRKVWDTILVALSEPIDISVTGATWDEEKTINRRVIQEIDPSDDVKKERTYKVYFETWTSATKSVKFNDPVIPILGATNNNDPTAILPCDQLIYTLTVNVSYRNMSSDKIRVWVDGASYDASSLKQEKTITTATSDIKSITFAIDNVPADSAMHTLHVECAGLGEGCFTPVSFRAPFSPKVVEPITITTPILNCSSPSTYTATVKVTTTNHCNAILTAKLGDKTLSKAVTGDVTTFAFEGLPADGSTGNTVTAYFDYVHTTLPTCEKTSAPFTAPIRPSVDTAKIKYGALTCNDIYTTLTFDVKYANQPAGDLEMWVDDDKASGHMIKLSSPTGFTPNSTLKTLSNQTIKFVLADSLNTHKLHVKFTGTDGCEEEFVLPRAPFMPHIESVNVSGLDAKSCGGSATYTATVTVNTTNQRSEAICVSLNGGTPQKKNPTGTSTVFTFTDLPANGSSNTVKAWFKCVGESCNQTETFTAPTLPKASVVLPASMPTVAACDQPTFDLTFDLKYTYQDGELQVWVARAGDATKYGLKTFTASLSDGDGKYIKLDKDENTKNITLTGLPSDGRSDYKLYFKFNESGYCGYSSPIETALLTFPRSPTITAVAVSGVPDKVADCTVETYDATVTVTYKYTFGEKIIIAYTDKDGIAKTCEPVTLTTSPQAITLDDVLNDIGKGAKSLEVYFQKSPVDFSSCHHSATYTAPSNSSINSGYEVTIDNKSTCGNRKYNLSGTITFSDDATDDLIISFPGVRDTTIAKGDCDKTGTPFTMTGLTAETAGKTLIAKFKDQPDCTAASETLEAVGVPGFTVDNMSFTTPTCDEITTTLKFDLKYTYQSGSKLNVWVDSGTKKEVPFETNKNNEITKTNIEIPNVSANGATHTLHVEFVGGRCPADAFTTPAAPFSGKISNIQTPVISDEECGLNTYSVSVTFDVSANSAGHKVIATCKGKTGEKDVESGTNTIKISGIVRTAPVEAGDVVIELYFYDNDNCDPRHSITFTENPFKPIPTFSLDPIGAKCYPATSFDVTYEHTNANKLYYKVTQGETKKKDWTEVTVDATKKFTISTSGWADGAYTVEAYVKSAVGCESATPHPTVTLTINKQPSLELVSIDNVCAGKSGVSTTVTLKDGATKYDYDVFKNGEVMSAQHKSGQTASSISLTTSTWEPATYKIQVTAYSSVDCPSDPVEVSFVIHPNPTITSLTDKVTVCEKTDHTASFAYEMSSLADKYDYSLEGTDIHQENQSVGTGGKGNIVFDPSGLSDGTYTLHVTARNSYTGCESAESTASLVINNQPELSFASIAAKCFPADEFEVKYTPSADAESFTYVVMKGSTEKQGEKTITVDASKKFTLNTSGWAAGTYTINATAKSSKNCYGEVASVNFIINEQPTAGITSVESKCVYEGTAKVVYTASANATKYSYTVFEGSTVKKNVTNQTISSPKEFTIDIASLGAGSYTLHLTTWAGDCPSEEATKDFTVYARPTITLDPAYTTSAGVKVCYPVAKVEIPYTSTDADTYTYELTVGSGTRTDTKSASASGGNIEVNTAGLSAGDYALSVTATSENGCVTAAAQTTVIKIKPQPSLELTDIDDVCEGTSGVSTTVTLKTGATKYNYDVLKNGVVMSAQHKEDQTSASISLFTGSWDPDTYTVQVTAISGDDCGSEMAEVSFVINPNPDITELTASQTICEEEDAVSYDFTITGAKTYSYSVVGTDIAETGITVPDGGSGTISFDPSVLSDGNYTLQVIAKSELGCTTTRNAVLKINNKPTVALTATTNICYLDPAELDFNYTVSADAYYYEFHLWRADRSQYYGGNGAFFTQPLQQSGTIHRPFSPYGSPLYGGDYIAVMWVKNSAGCVSDSVVVPFTIYPIAGIEIYTVASMCVTKPLSTVFYNIHNAKSFRYKIKGVSEWSGPQTPSTEDLKHFEFGISDLDPGNYTLQLQAYNDNCGYSNIAESPFTIYQLPTLDLDVTAAGVNVCYPVAQVDIPYTSTDAKEYTYVLTGGGYNKTDTKSASASGKIEVNTDGLPAGDYALSVTAVSDHECEIAAAQTTTIHINPRPTFTFKEGEVRDCHPSTSINVGYTSTNAKTYSYTLTLEGETTPSLAENNLTALAESVIALNTTDLAAGTYDLVVTATSKDGCDMLAPVSCKVIIQAKPTVTINSVESHCAGNARISVNYTTTDATTYYYEVLGTGLQDHADAEATGSFTIDISSLEPDTYTLRMKATAGQCESATDDDEFVIYPIPAVSFVTPAPIKEGVANVTVTLNLTDATKYDWRFIDKDGSRKLESDNNVSASQTTITLTTGALEEGIYTLYVTPHSATCDGVENDVHVVVNNKPTVNFSDADLVVCAGTETLNVEFSTSPDAVELTYSIKQGTTTVVGKQTIDDLATHPSPLALNVQNLPYGTYTLCGYVASTLENGDESTKDFIILAQPTIASVTQNETFIGCNESYTATVVVNLFNAAGRTIHAKYSDDGDEYTPQKTTNVGDETVTFTLSGLKNTGENATNTVDIFVEGYATCGTTATFNLPQTMTINQVSAVCKDKSCNANNDTVCGTVSTDCNIGTIRVEYVGDADIYYDIDLTTTDRAYQLIIPAGGTPKVKAYFLGKTCEPVVRTYTPTTMPEASINATVPTTLHCDSTTFDLDFTLDYTYQEEGTLTVWVDEDHKNIYSSVDNQYDVLAANTQLTGTIAGLPANGRTGQKLYFEFSGSHSCKGSIDLAGFPKTPVIKSVTLVKDVEYIEGLTGEYYPTVTVTYENAKDQTIVLEYFDKDDKPKYAESPEIDTDLEGSYVFDKTTATDWSFDDVTLVDRVVHAYFKGSEFDNCHEGGTHDYKYDAPTNCSIKFESIDPLINRSTCDHLSYDLTGKVSFVGVARGDLIVELTLDGKTFSGKIDHALVPDTELPFEIKNITKPIPDDGTQLTAYFLDLKTNTTILDYNVSTPVIPTVKVENATYSTPQCNESVTSLTFDLKYIKQQGNLRLFLDGVECYDYTIQTGAPLSKDDDTEQTATIVINNLPADLSVRDLWIWFDGASDCKPNFTMPQAPYSPKVTSHKAEITNIACDKDTYTLNVSFTVENSLGKDATFVFRGESVNVSTTDGTNYSHSFNNVARTYGDVTDDVVELSFAGNDADCSGALYSIAYTETPKPAISLTLAADQGTTTCGDRTYSLQGEIRYTYLDETPEIWLDDKAHKPVTVQIKQTAEQVINLDDLGINVPADGREHHVYIKPNGWTDACAIDVPFNALQQPIITAAEVSGVPAFISCGETYSATVTVDYVHAFGKTITVACTDNGSIQTYTSAAITDNDGQTVITLPSLSDHDGVTALSIYVDDETCAYTSASITQPKLNTIEPDFAVNVSATPCGVVDYAVWGTIKFNNAVGLGELIVKTEEGVQADVTIKTATSAEFRIEHYTVAGTAMQLTAYFSNWSDCKVQSDYFSSPDVPDLTLDNTAVDTVFTCGDKSYTVSVAFTPTNQFGTGYVLDSIANGAVRTVETISVSATAAQFIIARPAKAEQHFVVVRYPATGCEVITQALDINAYTKPKPLISLTAIDRLCNNETELILPLVITQGDIDEATLTLTNSKGEKVITAADMSINTAHDTLSYNLPSQLAAGKYTARVDARDTLDCETSASQSIEFALDGVVFSKWTDVLLVDNEGGLFTGYQWYENDKLLEGKTDQVLYLPEGMSGKSYYCVLQTAEGAIYTCVSDFGDLPRSADNPKTQSANHITVLPNRVATNGAVTVHQSLDENLHLILMSATGKRVAEYTQQEGTKLIDMPGVQGIYLLRIESDSDVQTVKIVVY